MKLRFSQFFFANLWVASTLIGCAPKAGDAIQYPGVPLRGTEAEVFAPGLISTAANEHSPLAFSPDGKFVLWSVMDRRYRGRMLQMEYKDGGWSRPATPSFADTTADHYCPSFSVDGKTLFFSSNRKAPPGYGTGRGNRIWTVQRTEDGWGSPAPLDTTVSKSKEFGHSAAANGNLYFAAVVGERNVDLFFSRKTNNAYEQPVALPAAINTAGYEDGPFISAGEDFFIFESTRPEGIEGSHDLYIVFKTKGGWSPPKNMGSKVNSSAMERFPRVSPDGKYFFFASNRGQTKENPGFDMFWMDAKVIDELR